MAARCRIIVEKATKYGDFIKKISSKSSYDNSTDERFLRTHDRKFKVLTYTFEELLYCVSTLSEIV